MTRQLRMTWFQVREFMSVPYFIQVMAVSTISITLVQFLAYRAWGGDPQTLWLRSGIIGMWTSSINAAGILGFERYKGTLVHLVLARINPLRPLAAVVGAAATFGIVALPLAWATWALVSRSSGFDTAVDGATTGRMALAVLLLWVGCLSITFVIAATFVLTPNAIAYEELLVQPILIASGILFTRQDPPNWLAAISRFIAIHEPASMLMHEMPPLGLLTSTVISLAVSLGWFVAAGLLGRVVLRRATVAGTLEVV